MWNLFGYILFLYPYRFYSSKLLIHLMITCTSSEPHTTSLLHREISSFSSYIISSSSMLNFFSHFFIWAVGAECHLGWRSTGGLKWRHTSEIISKQEQWIFLLVDKVQIIKGFQIILNILCRKAFHMLYLFYTWRCFIVIMSSVEFIWLCIISLFI